VITQRAVDTASKQSPATAEQLPNRRKRRANRAATLALVLGAIPILLPIGWLALTAFQPANDAYSRPPTFLFHPTLSNFAGLSSVDFVGAVGNSLVVMGASVGLALLLGIPAGYVIARHNFFGKRVLLTWLFFVYIIPALIWFIPLYATYERVHIIGSYISIVLVYETGVLPVTIFLMAGYFSRVSRSLDESAMIDGAGRWRILLQILVPTVLPGIATVASLACLLSWGEYFGALIFTDSSTQTAPVALASLIGEGISDWSTLAAGGLIVAVPAIVVVAVAQRGYLRGSSSVD
jgi:ABC-type glycerol-3-phosphate transport system permease component